jgi:hypothetical protein
VYVGEMVLAVGMLAFLVHERRWAAFRSPLPWLLVAFAAWGLTRTVPYVGRYGVNALRDAVIWGYGVFAILVATFLVGSRWLTGIPGRYGRWLPRFLLWVPIGITTSQLFRAFLPATPGDEDRQLLLMKPGDAGVHLAGIAAVLLLGLHRASRDRSATRTRLSDWLLWTAWLVAFVFAAALNRGGLLSALAAIGVVIALRPIEVGAKVGMVGVLALAATVAFFALEIPTPATVRAGRVISPAQIATNLESITGGSDRRQLEATRDWRLSWWSSIVDYTFRGRYFWTGKGFGVNLAEDDGFLPPGRILRSPHNGHLNVLARAGVPGLTLWVLLHATFAVSLLRAYLRARRARQDWWARVDVWILAYWAAFMVNATFDVFIEGPHGGIWFWSLFGLGIAVLEAQRRQAGAAPFSPAPGGASEQPRAWTRESAWYPAG